MTVICLEGPSAVGKSSTARALERTAGLRWIREVNALFRAPTPEPAHWYDEQQVKRWRLAQASRRAVLDGDPFQSLWYAWTYSEELPDLRSLLAFYSEAVRSGRLAFPDLYVLLQASETQLRERRAGDPTRTRRNFEHHLRLLKTQPLYFSALERAMPGRVVELDAVSVEENVRQVAQALQRRPPRKPEAGDVFAELAAWRSV